jgi:hypothetical protein
MVDLRRYCGNTTEPRFSTIAEKVNQSAKNLAVNSVIFYTLLRQIARSTSDGEQADFDLQLAGRIWARHHYVLPLRASPVAH